MAHLTTLLRGLVLRIHPARSVVIAFGMAVVLGTSLLALPFATESGTSAGLVDALFTATSAVCVTGLAVVDTGTYWSGFGQGVILALMQVGGFGIMTLASLLALLIAGRLRLRMALHAQAETRGLSIGDVRQVVQRVALITVVVESVTAVILTLRFFLGHGMAFGTAVYHGVFHAVAAFTNGSFSLNADSLMAYATDPWVIVPVMVAVILGGLGFPVILELLRHRQRQRATGLRNWSLHLKLTLVTTAVLLLAGVLLMLLTEWGGRGTLGGLDPAEKVLNAFFYSAATRTAGFNTVDTTALQPATLLGTDVLMFIGGGSASTAGGIKVTTFAVLGAAILAEVRGEPTSVMFGRRLPSHVLREGLTVALLSIGVVIASTLVLLTLVDQRLEVVLFEVVSAFGTVGLSAGLTPELPPAGRLVIIALMFVGRVGPITLASALALRERAQRYRLPEERPIIG